MAVEFNLRKAILQYRDPNIVLDELGIVDTSSQKGDIATNDQKSGNIQKKYTGLAEPLIRINSATITGIKHFTLDLTGFKPTLLFRFETTDERFLYTAYPKDGDIISLYIRPFGELFKPIRMDFIINEVISPFNNGPYTTNAPSTGKFLSFTVMGEVRIPKLYKHICKNINGTSTDALIKIAEDLGLGYASNEVKMNDSMNWLSPNLDYEAFIKNIVNGAWLGEEDYFDCWIDQYYNINLVNLKKQFDEQNSTLETMRMAYGVDSFGDLSGGAEPAEVEFPVLLLNKDLGYFQKIQFYDDKLKSDKPKNKFVEYSIESITNKNLGTRDTLNKGRLGEDVYKEEEKKTYIGTMYFDNVHENFQQASIQNILNRNDSYKTILKVRNRAWTPFLYRGQTFPVIIMSEGSTTASSDSAMGPGGKEASVAPDGDKRVPNVFLSGNYVVLGFNLEFTPTDGIYQNMILGKKQWSLNPGTTSDPNTLDPNVDDAQFNDLAKNASTILQREVGITKSSIFGG
jgi:hypothetical protein